MTVKKKDSQIILIALSVFIYLLTSFLFLFAGKIHVDEPFYFTITNLVNNNYLPYRDFFYTQTPLFPYIFSLPQMLLGPGLYTARLTSIFFGLLTLLLVIECSWKKGSKNSAVIAAALIGFNPFLIYHFTFVKLYSLLAFLTVLAARILISDLNNTLKYSLIALVLSLSTAVRITTLPALIIVALFILLIKKEIIPFICYAVSGFITLIAVFLPFLINAKEQMIYGIWGYLMDRDVLPFSGIFKAKFLFLSEFSKHFNLYIICLVISVYLLLSQKSFNDQFKFKRINEISLCWLILIVLALPHLLTKISYVSEYLSFIMPLMALLLGFKITKFFDSIQNEDFKILLTLIFFIASSIVWVSNTTDFIGLKNKTLPVKYLNQVAEYLKIKTPIDAQILSFNNAIVILSERKIIPGYEMNSCSFDQDWDESRCKKHRILNVDMLSKIIENKDADAILITENTFLGNFPSFFNISGIEVTRDTVMPLIKKYYTLDKTYPQLGNMSENANLYLPKKGY